MTTARVAIPISKRPLDAVLAIVFVVIAFIGVFMDSANIFAPALDGGKIGMSKEYVATAVWPPQVFIQTLSWWCDIADPLLCANPMWLKAMCFVSPLIYAPFFLVAAYAFLAGKEWIRVPMLCICTSLVYSLTVILIEHAVGPYASPDLQLIFAAYGPYWLLPVFLIIKLGINSHPFTVPAGVSAQKKKQ